MKNKIRILAMSVALACLASVGGLSSVAFAQTYAKTHALELVLPSAGSDITHTLTLVAQALSTGAATVTMPGESLTFPATNASGVLTNPGTGILTWSPAMTNPMTSPGDMIYGGLAGVPSRLATTSTANQILLSGANAAPAWSTATYPATTTANQLLYSSGDNTVTGLAIGTNGQVLYSNSGVPAYATLGTDSTLTGIGTTSNFGIVLSHSDDWTAPQYFSSIGVNTTSPNVKLDVNGDFATRATTDTTTLDTINDLSTSGTSTIFIPDEPAAFTITGFANGYNGKHLILYNKSGKDMTLAYHNTGSSAGNRINTLSANDITLKGSSAVEFFYDGSANEWVVASTTATGGTQGAVGAVQSVLRASSQTYTTTTLINDTDFSWNVGASQTWEVDGVLSFSASDGNGLGVAINIPGTPSSIMIAVNGFLVVSASQNAAIGASIITSNDTVCANPPTTNVHSSDAIVLVHGVFTTGSTGGTTYLAFSNNPSKGGGATVNSDSYLRVTRLQ